LTPVPAWAKHTGAVAFSARGQRHQHRDGFGGEWIQVALIVLAVVLVCYVLLIR